jgi:hypothetical protein
MGIGDQHQSPYWSNFVIPPKVLGLGAAKNHLARQLFHYMLMWNMNT